MQVAIWGIGEKLRKYAHVLHMDQISCFVDSDKAKSHQLLYGKNVISPDELKNYCVDYIVISSNVFFNEIAQVLITEYGVDCRQILNFDYYLYLLGEASLNNQKIIDIIHQLTLVYNIRKILDVEMFLLDICYWKKEEFLQIDGYSSINVKSTFKMEQYTKVWLEGEDIQDEYDLAVLLYPGKNEYENICQKICLISKNVLVLLTKDMYDKEEAKGEGILVNFEGYLFWAIRQKEELSLKIFEVSHKPFVSMGDPVYKPLYVGTYGSEQGDELRDSTGDNISKFNKQINECTALYWIWKNAEYKLLGLNHYRRFFMSPINKYSALQEWEIYLMFDFFDIGVAESVYFHNNTVKDVLKEQIVQDAFECTYAELKKIFACLDERNQEAFEYVMTGRRIYPCNMFLMSKEVLHKYCEWLFPILFQLLESVKIDEEWDAYSQRVMGFFAERLLAVWLVQQNYKLKEFPVLLVGQDGPYGKEERLQQ